MRRDLAELQAKHEELERKEVHEAVAKCNVRASNVYMLLDHGRISIAHAVCLLWSLQVWN